MNRLAIVMLALVSVSSFAQNSYSSRNYVNSTYQNQGKSGVTLSAGFEIGSSNAQIQQPNLNSFSQFQPQNTNQSNEDYDLSMKGFNIQGSFDWGMRFSDSMSTSTNFGVSYLTSSDSDDNNNNNNNNLNNGFNNNFSNQNLNQSVFEAKKTSVYIEQALNFNSEFDGFILQPFIALNLGVGKFTLDSKANNNDFFNFSSAIGGFQNLESNFFQAGASIGANFIISDTFVPFIKGRFTKEFHSISNYNSGLNNTNTSSFNQGNIDQDPDLDSTTISGIIGIGFAF